MRFSNVTELPPTGLIWTPSENRRRGYSSEQLISSHFGAVLQETEAATVEPWPPPARSLSSLAPPERRICCSRAAWVRFLRLSRASARCEEYVLRVVEWSSCPCRRPATPSPAVSSPAPWKVKTRRHRRLQRSRPKINSEVRSAARGARRTSCTSSAGKEDPYSIFVVCGSVLRTDHIGLCSGIPEVNSCSSILLAGTNWRR
jgi:hypothetical protein